MESGEKAVKTGAGQCFIRAPQFTSSRQEMKTEREREERDTETETEKRTGRVERIMKQNHFVLISRFALYLFLFLYLFSFSVSLSSSQNVNCIEFYIKGKTEL